ncbi:MAG TPA: UPF0280 family protein [Methanoculleus sp.]|nr:UPF0280 family protein [Methanoculleus sp.]
MIREHFQYRTTITTILAERQEYIEAAKDAMISARTEIEAIIATDPFFAVTYEPYPAPAGSLVAGRMADAAKSAGVGPMAAVAGTIAWAGVEAMEEAGAEFGIVDNGGDIAVVADRPVRIGLYAGTSPLSGKLAFLLPPQEEILGICTSSATVGPSVSFGTADAVTVFSRNVSLADAWATALCNIAGTGDTNIFSRLNPDEVQGVFIVHGEEIHRWGDLPEIAAANVDLSLITAGH